MDTINSTTTTGSSSGVGAGEVEIRVHKGLTATFTVQNGTRPEIERAISNRLDLGEELLWNDDPEGINAVVISQSSVWRPRRRFFVNTDK